MILEPDDIDWSRYMQDTDIRSLVRAPKHWEDDLVAEFAPELSNAKPHPRLPWDRTWDKIAIRPGEVSLWFGFNGSGKSLILGQTIISQCAQDEIACIASFEMRPRKTLARMARQVLDDENPLPGNIREFVEWCSGRLWLYDQTGSVVPDKVYAVIRYCAAELGITQFVVDNLTKCVASDDDYAGQKQVVDKLTCLAQSLDMHIHLVHHARKDRDESRPPRKMDALGASAITNLVDNVFILWRNKAKWESETPKLNEPDAMLICDKQRHGTGWEGALNLNYHQRSQQYIAGGNSAMNLSVWPHT